MIEGEGGLVCVEEKEKNKKLRERVWPNVDTRKICFRPALLYITKLRINEIKKESTNSHLHHWEIES